MSQITPLAYVVVQNIEAQRNGAVEKERQLRKAGVQEKNIAAHDEVMEHQVESTEEVQPVGDEPEQEKQRRKRKGTVRGHEAYVDDDGNPHIDLTA